MEVHLAQLSYTFVLQQVRRMLATVAIAQLYNRTQLRTHINYCKID